MPIRKGKRRSKKQREFVQTLLFFLTTFMSIVGLILYLWVYTEVDETLMVIDVQSQVAQELTNSIDELKMDIAALGRVDRLTTVARKELGMVVAKPETLVIFVDPDLLAENFD